MSFSGVRTSHVGEVLGRRWTAPLISGALIGAVGLTAGGVGVATAEQERGGGRGKGSGRAENVILFVGDGMGASARDAGRLSKVGLEGELVMDSLPYVGMLSTDSADPEGFVTDSAAAATSLASGIKTYNGAIGLDVDGNRVQTLIERAERAGKSTGIVTTAQVTDATGAAFGAHVTNRSEQSEIARQYIEETGVDVLLGGGEDFWYPEGDPGAFPDSPPEDPDEGSRSNRGNLVERAEELGYEYVNDARGLRRADDGKLLGLFANAEMFQQRTEAEGGAGYDPVVSLRAMTRKAIATLSEDDDGFFLVVE